jgi:4-hydroxybenzoate polyprenyltransferase
VYTFGFFSIILLGASALVSLFYVLPIKNKSLRDIPHLKIHLISLICLIAIGFFQLINENDFELKNWLFVGAHYFFILAIAIPFDIRDLQHDNFSQKTIPQVFGERKSKLLSLFLLLLYTFLILLLKPIFSSNFAFLLIISAISIVILNVNKNRSEFFFSGIIEGSIFALGIMFLLN